MARLSDIDLRLLQVFKCIVECGGMSAAELELNIGTSTVSRHLKDLETRLGMVLCRRGRGGFALTDEGRGLYDAIQALFASLDNFRARVDDIHQRMGGELSLAVFDKTASNPEARVAQAIARFADEAPLVKLSLHVATINGIERGVIDGTFHVGIIPFHRSSESLGYANLFEETMLLYCGAAHPLYDAADRGLSWDNVRPYAFAGLGYHSPNMELTQWAGLRRAVTGFDQESIATLILSGRFLGFLPDHYARSFEQQGLLRPLNPRSLNYRCKFLSIWRRSPAASPATQKLLELLKEVHTK